jgi:tRNA G18 (ribose-2'-O)-methylase SpoU
LVHGIEKTRLSVTRIASVDDPAVADYRLLSDPLALARAGLFVAEGRLVVRRLLAGTRFVTRSVLVTDAALDAMREALAATHAPVFVIDQKTMNDVAGFNIHRGCLALAERPVIPSLADLPLDAARLVVVMEGVNNPDNVGGIFRSASAFGVDAVILGPSCSDPLYRKSVRTSMAATLDIPFADAGAWPQAIADLRARGFTVLALTPSIDALPIDEIPRDLDRVAILVGAEGEGLSDPALTAADRRVRVPMFGAADSLNVTVAASVAMYAVSGRLRR